MRDIVAAYKTGIRDFGSAILVGANLVGADLRDANLRSADLRSADLGGAHLRRANLRNADLRSAELCNADLRSADLAGADLRSADLVGASLVGADLVGADLVGANLVGANLGDQWVVQGPARSDGYWFFLQKLTPDKEPMVKAGCRRFTLPEARKYWQETRGGTPLGAETFAILDCLEALAKARGLI